MIATRDLLKKWEAGDSEARDLWQRMNGWVYDGFDTTYAELGIDFDKHYYESEIYQEDRKIILDAVESGKPTPTSGKAGLAVVRVLEAAQRSLEKNGERIHLAESE